MINRPFLLNAVYHETRGDSFIYTLQGETGFNLGFARLRWSQSSQVNVIGENYSPSFYYV